MTRSTLLKFRLITLSNVKSLVMINLILLIPALIFLYTLVKIVPVVLRYIDTMNVSVLGTSPEYKRLAVVVFSPAVDRASGKESARRSGIRKRPGLNLPGPRSVRSRPALDLYPAVAPPPGEMV